MNSKPKRTRASTPGALTPLVNLNSQTAKVTPELLERLTEFDDLQDFRECLRDWYMAYLDSGFSARCDRKDIILFEALDEWFAMLQTDLFHKSQNNKNTI